MRPRLARLATVAALAAACGSDPGQGQTPQDLGGLTRVSGASAFAQGCQGAPQREVEFRGAEVEPFVAIDPGDPAHLVGVWQQDRFPNSGASGILTGISGDGGRTWRTTAAHFSRCTGGDTTNGGDYERASDPWVAVAPDGTVHQVALAFDVSRGARKTILASRSTDGGSTWSEPIAIAAESSADVDLDKETLTADPSDARFIYAVWDRLTGVTSHDTALQAGPAWFSRSADGGASWEPARVIFDPGLDAQTIASQIAVLPSGALVNVFVIIASMSSPAPVQSVAAVLSHDRGTTWSQPIIVSEAQIAGVVDPKSRQAVRTGSVVPAVAVDRQTGRIYAAWEDARFDGGARDGIVLSWSDDGGLSWSAPRQVNQATGSPAFTPAIAVASSGEVGITYYDFSEDDPGDPSRLSTSCWLVTSRDGGSTWRSLEVARRFDLRNAPVSEGLFLGDYQGLVHDGRSFIPFFVMANDGNAGNRTDVFTTSSAILAARSSAVASAF